MRATAKIIRLKQFLLAKFMLGNQKATYQVFIIWSFRIDTEKKNISEIQYWLSNIFTGSSR